MNDHPCKTPFADLKKHALEHYEDVASKAHHWNSFVPKAIEAYNPEAIEQYLKWLDEEIGKGNKLLECVSDGKTLRGQLWTLNSVREQFLTIFQLNNNGDKGADS